VTSVGAVGGDAATRPRSYWLYPVPSGRQIIKLASAVFEIAESVAELLSGQVESSGGL